MNSEHHPSLFTRFAKWAAVVSGRASTTVLVITVIVNVIARLLVWKVSAGQRVGVSGGG